MHAGTPCLILTADLPRAATRSARTIELADPSHPAGFASSNTSPSAELSTQRDTATPLAEPSTTAWRAGHAASETCPWHFHAHAPTDSVRVGAHRPRAARLVVASAVAGTRGAPRAAPTGSAGAAAVRAHAARTPSACATAGPAVRAPGPAGDRASTTEATSRTAGLASTSSSARSSTTALASTGRAGSTAGPSSCGTAGRRASVPNAPAATARRRAHAGIGRLLRFRGTAARTHDRQGQRDGAVSQSAHVP
jgi:hypothetical protein